MANIERNLYTTVFPTFLCLRLFQIFNRLTKCTGNIIQSPRSGPFETGTFYILTRLIHSSHMCMFNSFIVIINLTHRRLKKKHRCNYIKRWG